MKEEYRFETTEEAERLYFLIAIGNFLLWFVSWTSKK